jgi:hypothetical protein
MNMCCVTESVAALRPVDERVEQRVEVPSWILPHKAVFETNRKRRIFRIGHLVCAVPAALAAHSENGAVGQGLGVGRSPREREQAACAIDRRTFPNRFPNSRFRNSSVDIKAYAMHAPLARMIGAWLSSPRFTSVHLGPCRQ